MRFVKMHGIGNDYIFVNCFEQKVADPQKLAPVISHRHKGVGSDGLILVLPPEENVDAHVRMRMFNADGSEAEMCGNGIRCVCKLAHDEGISRHCPMRVQTANGVLTLHYTINGEGTVECVTVNMGKPTLEPDKIPTNLTDLPQVVNHSIKDLVKWPPDLDRDWTKTCGLDQRMTCVSMGNPHAVFFCKDVASIPLEKAGKLLEHHPVFPNRINVHFVHVVSRGEVKMRTWERGSGLTLACGTGASAVCVAGVLTDRTDRQIFAHLPGGDLDLDWSDKDDNVYMTGSATQVFSGQWPND